MASIRVPFQFNAGRVLSTKDPSVIAEQKIIDVLVTNRYERVMNHSYGAGINQLLFEPIDSMSISDFSIDAQQEMVNNISRVYILNISMEDLSYGSPATNPDTTLGVTVSYALPLGSPQVLSFKIESAGIVVEDTPI